MLAINRASAGSGKTYTLAKDYIRMLLALKTIGPDGSESFSLNFDHKSGRLKMPNRHRRILAITFTKKATEEMKTRILRELDALTDTRRPADYRQYLTDLLHCSPTDLAATAAIAMRQLLFDYQSFHVSTIDSFFQRVLHTFARELDFLPDYNVEMDSDGVLAAAVSNMLHQFNYYRPRLAPSADDPKRTEDFARLEKWITKLMRSRLYSDSSAAPNFFNRKSSVHGKLLKQLSKITHEHFNEFSTPLRAYFKTSSIADFEKKIEETNASILESLKSEITAMQQSLNWADVNANKLGSLKNACAAIAAGEFNYKDESCTKLFIKAETQTAAALKEGNSDFAFFKKGKQTPEGTDALFAIYHTIAASVVCLKDLEIIAESLDMLQLLSCAWPYIDDFAIDNNALMMWNTNSMVGSIIAHDSTPFVYERMGVDLAHFLIDEFQDTSSLQWQNLCPLVLNGLGNGDDSLIIGDEKQSIYRFRNSDSSILSTQVAKDCANFLAPGAGAATISTNHRSAPQVVNFNNAIFEQLAADCDVSGYDNVRQHVFSKFANTGGLVKMFQCSHPLEALPFNGALRFGKEEALHMMAQIILRQHRQGKYRWKDIAILTNTNSEARTVVEFLLNNYSSEISVLSDEALLISNSSAVRLIVSILRLIDKEGNVRISDKPDRRTYDQAMLALERYEVLLSEALADKKPDSLPADDLRSISVDALSAAAREESETALESIRRFMRLKPASLSALIELIIAHNFTEQQRQSQAAYICAFQDLAVEFTDQKNGSLHAFLKWWDSHHRKLTVTGADETDAVRVLTIHKSKGLEYPCVHIPFCSWAPDWDDKHAPEVWTEMPRITGIDPATAPPAALITIKRYQESPYSLFHNQYTAEQKLAAADQLNRTYVAFTRAQFELHVWLSNAKNSYGSLVYNALTSIAPALPDAQSAIFEQGDADVEFPEGILPDCSALPDYNPETENPDKPANRRGYTPLAVFSYGSPTVKQQKKETEEGQDQAAIVLGYPVNRHHCEKNVLTVDNILDTDSDIDDTPIPEKVADTDPARERGKAFHRIVGATRTPSMLKQAVARELEAGAITAQEAQTIEAALSAHIDSCRQEGLPWFEGYKALYVEQPIFIPGDDKLRRPDRIAVTEEGEWQVVEYKFTEDEFTKGQKAQASTYASLLRQMGHHARAYLCYPLKATIHPL